MMEENEERKEAIKELKYLFYTMPIKPIKPPTECDDKDSVSRQDAIYYVKVPENLVAIDFDLRDKDENKSSSGIHLYFK